MFSGCKAEQNCLLGTRQQRIGDVLGLGTERQRNGRVHTFGCGHRRCNFGDTDDEIGLKQSGTDGHQPVIGDGMNSRQGRTAARCQPQALSHQRMVLAEVGADNQCAIELRQRGNRTAQTEGTLESVVLLTQPVVDVLAAHGPQHSGQQSALFQRACGRHKTRQRRSAVIVLDRAQAL